MNRTCSILLAAAILLTVETTWGQCPSGSGGGSPAILVNADFYWGPQTYAGQNPYAQHQLGRQLAVQQMLQQRAAATAFARARNYARDQQRLATRRLQRERVVAEREARKREVAAARGDSSASPTAERPNAEPSDVAAVTRAVP